MGPKLFGGVGPVTRSSAVRDALAGVTLASMNIPQVMGYTRIAETPVVTGLYTAFLPLLAFTIFGASRHLVVAADSATAAIFAASLSHMAHPGGAQYMALVGVLALMTAAFLSLARLFKLGFLADFLARTVLVGFLAGVGLQVGIAMLGDMFGLAVTAREPLGQIWQIVRDAPKAHLPTLALAVGVAATILLGRRLVPKLPVPLFLVLGAIAASASLGFAQMGIATIGPVTGGLPSIALPTVTWSQAMALSPVAGSCFVMILAQSAATSRAFAERYNERGDENADILGLAAANAVAGLAGAFVVNGSPTQTALAERAGARSQVAQQTFAAIVLLVLLFFTGPLQYLPRSVLAAVVFTIGLGMIDLRALANIRRESPGEFGLALITAGAVVGVGVEPGILLAIGLSLFRHVRHSYEPHTMMMVPDASGRWAPVATTPGRQTAPGLIVYRFGADLWYANRNRFVDEVRALVDQAPTPVKWLIVDAEAITDIDYSAAISVRKLMDDLTAKGVRLLIARVSASLRSDLERHRVIAAFHQASVFDKLHEAVAAAGFRSDIGNL
jgi:MFS superfamily sulfate permease-like transporter